MTIVLSYVSLLYYIVHFYNYDHDDEIKCIKMNIVSLFNITYINQYCKAEYYHFSVILRHYQVNMFHSNTFKY